MLETESAIAILVRLKQDLNAESPMFVTLLGIVMLVAWLRSKAVLAIATTGRPLIESGTVTGVAVVPLYRWIVIDVPSS
jgi:hypothetical protein